jgi:hypothetical protein
LLLLPLSAPGLTPGALLSITWLSVPAGAREPR